MKKKSLKITALAIFGTFTGMLYSQTPLHKWAIGLDASYKEYNGEFGNTFFKFKHFNLQPGITVNRYLNRFWDAGAAFNYGKFRGDNYNTSLPANLTFEGLMSSLNVKFKFNNDLMLSESSRFAPYLTAGVAYHMGKKHTPTSPTMSLSTNTIFIPLGAGLKYQITERFAATLQTQWMPSFTDKLDHQVSGKLNDQLWEHKIGIAYQFGKSKNKSVTKENDQDGDGVSDNVDRCPSTPTGAKVDKFGCTIVDENANIELSSIVKSINFKTGSSEILTESYSQLDKVVTLMGKFSSAKLIVEGHTDNTGNAESNMQLSQQRAESVRNYLIGKGIDANRIASKGYGSTMPVATNDTEAGRALNRRVELILTR